MQTTSTSILREVQRFRQIWLWLLILTAPAVFAYGTIQQLVLKKPFGNHPTSDIALVVLAVAFGLMLPLFFYLTNLTIEVKRDGIYIRFFPFQFSFKKIKLDDLQSYQAVTYSPLKDYGGWGIRYGIKGRAYNISGNRGVQLEFKNGKRLLVGSHNPEALVRAIDMLKRS